MGQKTNPNIFRLGKTKEWDSKYCEKKSNELTLLTFKDLEIRKFIQKFFKQYGLKIHKSKLYYSENALQIFISYYVSSNSLLNINKINDQQKIKIKKFNKIKKNSFIKLKKKIYRYKNYNQKFYNKTNIINKKYFLKTKIQRLPNIDNYKKILNLKQYKNINQINNNKFIEKFLSTIQLFTNKKTNIVLNLEQLNTNKTVFQTFSKKKKKLISTNLIKLRKFQRTEFFKKGVNLLYNCVIKNKTSDLLSQYLALSIKKLKHQNFFLRFVQNTLKLFIHKKFSKLQGIKIKIKGRFNGAPRAKTKYISIGKNIPTLTLNTNINYSESTAYTSNGTFGVKVWVYE